MLTNTAGQQAADGAVRVTERIMSEPNGRGERTVVAYAGQTLSLADAHRLGVPHDKLEGIGLAGRLALANVRGEELDLEAAAAAADAGAPGDNGTSSADPAAPDLYPQHRGGNWWTLSDGSKYQGGTEAALQAEAMLRATTIVDGDVVDGDVVDGDVVDEEGETNVGDNGPGVEVRPDGSLSAEISGDGTGEALPPISGDGDQAGEQ